jgi:hypothetical protein
MASSMKLKSGSKMQLAFDVPIGQEPAFDMICTFAKELDESAFLISVPMRGGQPLPQDDSRKLLFRYGTGTNAHIIAGYADDVVSEGIRRYWKIRRVSDQRQFFRRADERVKVALKVEYCQDTWNTGKNGVVEKEEALTLDISAGGAAIFADRRFEVGEICELSLPHIGTAKEGRAIENIVSVVCWTREAPKGSQYHNICGLQFRFADGADRGRIQDYVENIKKKYKL